MATPKESIRNLIREGDALKKEVDAFSVESQGVVEDMGLADRKQRLQKLLQRSKDLNKKATKLEQRVTKHTKGKESAPVNRFNEVKADELKRLKSLKNRLEKLKESLIPDETEEEYFRQMEEEAGPTPVSEVPVVNVGPGANSLLEDDEEEEMEEEYKRAEKNNEQKAEENQEKKIPAGKSGSKLSRLSLFRRSSKTARNATAKPKVTEGKATEKTKKKKEREKLMEKQENQEHAKREKQEQEKLEKGERERPEKERKEKMQKAAKEGAAEKRKTGKSSGRRLDEISERLEEDEDKDGEEQEDTDADDDDNNEDVDEEDNDDEELDSVDEGEDDDDDGNNNNQNVAKTSVAMPLNGNQKSLFGRRQKTSPPKHRVKAEEPKSSREKKGWKLFQRHGDRKMTTSTGSETKEKGTPSKEAEGKKNAGPSTTSSKVEVVEEDSEEENGSNEDDDDDDDAYEDEEEVSAEEDVDEGEEVSVEDEEENEEEVEEEEEEDDDDDDDDDEDDDYEDDSQYEEELGGTGGSNVSDGVFHPPDEGMERFEAVCDFVPEQTEDLGFKRGDIITVINTREDGWWMAEDEEGNRGLVPSTYLKLKKEYGDYRDLQSPADEDPAFGQGGHQKSGVELWKGLRKAVNETSVTDVLNAMGAIPSGFRPSTTARLLKEDQYTLCNVLKPRLSQSHLAFKDLFWNPSENKIRTRTSRVQKIVSLMMLKNMPQVGAGLETKTRHVRLAVFDRDKVLSNIHTVQATHIESDPKTWKFSPKMTSMLPSSLDGNCFVRTNHADQNIGILFEVCISYVRTKTGKKGELSCGWVHLPLFDEATGGLAINKVYELPIKGGTPYEQDVEVDPSISRKASTSKFRNMMTANKSPRLVVKLSMPTKEQKADLDTLPDTVVSSACYISPISMYRRLLAETALIDRIDLQSTDLIHSPVLSSFPKATLYPDIMDALRSSWADKKRTMKKSDKRDLEQMKKLFKDTCMESIYLLLRSATLPLYTFGDKDNEQERWEEISGLVQKNQTRGVLDYLLKPGMMHMPFGIGEVTLNLLEVYHEES